MEEIIHKIGDVVGQIVVAVLVNYQHNWLPLLAAIVVAAVMQAFVNPERLKRAMSKRNGLAIVGAVTVGAFTPLCACGTTAVIVGMLSATVPWGPVMAFLTSSPLMSPDGFVMLAGVITLKFAIGMLIASLVIGLGSGAITTLIDRKTSFLADQTRFRSAAEATARTKTQPASCACDPAASSIRLASALHTGCGEEAASCSCASADAAEQPESSVVRAKLRAIWKAIVDIGLKQIIPFFTLFIAIGSLINILVPTSWIVSILGPQNITAIPLAALVGLPLYVTGDSAVPLIKSLIDGGASQGAMMAFMITGAATSAWVIAGLATFMKRRAVLLYTGLILVGGILCGYAWELVVRIGL